MASRVLHGLIAGAVGTTALNAVTYLDMALRGRPASSTPEQVVEKGAALLHLPLPQDAAKREARLTGTGALLGMAAGTAAGGVLGVVPLRSPVTTALCAFGIAMLVGNGPMTVLRVTDPRQWSREDWVADVVPHAGYALAATGALRALGR